MTFFVELAIKVTWNFLLSFSVRRGVKNKNECAALFFSSTSARQFLLNYIQCFVSKHYEFILLSVIFFQTTDRKRVVLLMRLGASHSPGKPRVRSKVSRCGICGEQSGTGTGSFPGTSAFPCQYHSTNSSLASDSVFK